MSQGPGLQLITASRLTPLVAHCVAALRAAPLSPLAMETIVVQSQGMRRWVTLQLADALGCAGSLALPFPAAFIHDVARRVLPAPAVRDAELAFDRETLAWRIDALLRTLPDAPVYDPLTRYVRATDDRARFGLASRIADRFDDYQLYRADVLAAWEAGSDTPDTEHARWQAALWRTLCTDIDAPPPHAGTRLRQLLTRLDDGNTPRGLPARVTVFGVSTLPPQFTALLGALARHVPVRVYAAMPTAAPPHPLVASFGAQGLEFIDALRSHGAMHLMLDDAGDAEPTSALARLHAEIARGDSGAAAFALHPSDPSLRVHSAHGEMRQLEIVRDQLLDALAADATLRPHDLLLLVPDAATWAPLVDAVFGAVEADMPRIPYRIADRPTRRDDEAAAALSMLLAMQGGRLPHSEVFELLALPLVHEAAGLAEGQVDALQQRTHEANARWGYDAPSRAALGLPAYEDGSWRAALDRLLLGTTTGPHDDTILDLLPHAGHTRGDSDGLARLAEWVDAVAATLANWEHPRTLPAWVDAITDAVDLLFGTPGMRDAAAVSGVLGLLDRLRALDGQSGYTGEVPFGVVRDWLDAELGGDGFGSGFLMGGMTVAALKPMRSLPFRVIAVVGLNDGVFPRRDLRTAFDLLAHERRAGDRDLRSDDRQLFLDLLLAAGERVVLAYSGRTVNENAPCAPSVVVDELLDHLDRRSGGAARAAVLVEHPLQPFSPRYFSAARDPRLFTYSTAQARTAVATTQARDALMPFVTGPVVPQDDDGFRTLELTIRDLGDCWCNSSRYFCRHALGFTLPRDDEAAGDDELLTLDAMTKGLVRSVMLTAALQGADEPARELRRMQGSGALPPAGLGVAWHTMLRETVDGVLALLPQAPASSVPVHIAEDDWRVVGTLSGVYADARYVARAGAVRAEHHVRAWVEHVVMCAAHEAGDTSLPRVTKVLGIKEKKPVECLRFEPVPDALPLLRALVREARRGRSAPLPFFPQAAVSWLQVRTSKRSSKDPQQEAVHTYHAEESTYTQGGDACDPHVALCFRDVDPMTERWDEFEALVHLLFASRLPAGAA